MMPRIPTVQSNGNLPQQGVPRGTAGTPSVQQPFAPQGLGQGTAQGITQIGSTLVDLAEAGKHARRAQDVLDSTQQAQEFEIAMQARFAELSQGDFRTLPEDTVQAGRDLIKEMRQGLNNQAGQRFETQAVDFLGNLQAKALGIQNGRRNEQKKTVFHQAVTLHTRGIAEADNQAERAYHETSLQELFIDARDAGLITGTDAANGFQEALDGAVLATARKQMRLTPEAMEIALEKRAEAGQELYAGVPIANLLDEVRQVARQQRQERDSDERRQELLLAKDQGNQAKALRSEIMVLDPTPANTRKFRALLNRTNTMAANDDLDEGDHTQITGTLRSMINASLSPEAFNDDPEVLRNVAFIIESAQTPEEARIAQALLAQNASRLKPETFMRLNARVEARADATHYSNRDMYRQGVSVITRAAFPPGVTVLQELDPQAQQQLLFSLDAFDRSMQEAQEQGGAIQVDRLALPEARRIRDTLFEAQVTPQLPLELYPTAANAPQTDAEALRIIAKLAAQRQWTQEQQQLVFKAWQETMRLQKELDRKRQERQQRQ